MFGSVALASTFPALNPDGRLSDIVYVLDEIEEAERDYCRAAVANADCSCFARVAGHILQEGTPYNRRAINADRIDLARNQATRVCRGSV